MSDVNRLAEVLNISVDKAIDIDKGMWDILIMLNDKNYFTYACCEGHLNENGHWNGYIAFKSPYKFVEYPKSYDSSKYRTCFYWSGNDEESRQEFLKNLYEWTLSLPVRKIQETKSYFLWGKNKYRRNSKWRILCNSSNYEDIRIRLNYKQIERYEIKITEKIIGRV